MSIPTIKNPATTEAVERFLTEKAQKLAARVTQLFMEGGSVAGVASGVMIHAEKFTPKDVERALQLGLVTQRKGKGGGLFPAGSMPAPKERQDSCTAKAFQLLLDISRNDTISDDIRGQCRALYDERETLNANRRKGDD